MVDGLRKYSIKNYARCVRDICSGKPLAVKEASMPSGNSIFIPRYDCNHIRNIAWFNDFLSVIQLGIQDNLIKNAIVHGSYGDATNTGFSDLELTLVLSSRATSDHEKAMRLKNWLKQRLNPLLLNIDPLQHHGAFFLWEDLLVNYNNAILPIKSYEKSWGVKEGLLGFQIDKHGGSDSEQSFYITRESLKEYKIFFFKFGMNPYSIKRLISNILLFPAFFYQSKGFILTKPEAINKAMNEGVDVISDMIEAGTLIRADWKLPPEWLGTLRGSLKGVQIPSGKLDRIFSSLYTDSSVKLICRNEILPRIRPYLEGFEILNKRYENNK